MHEILTVLLGSGAIQPRSNARRSLLLEEIAHQPQHYKSKFQNVDLELTAVTLLVLSFIRCQLERTLAFHPYFQESLQMSYANHHMQMLPIDQLINASMDLSV